MEGIGWYISSSVMCVLAKESSDLPAARWLTLALVPSQGRSQKKSWTRGLVAERLKRINTPLEPWNEGLMYSHTVHFMCVLFIFLRVPVVMQHSFMISTVFKYPQLEIEMMLTVLWVSNMQLFSCQRHRAPKTSHIMLCSKFLLRSFF